MATEHPNNKPSIEWYTPISAISPFVQRYGANFLDPCAAKNSPILELTPYAKVLGVEGWDGLTSDWSKEEGEWVFVNPPFGRTISQWISKVLQEAKASGRPIILLVPARTDARWFREAVDYPGVRLMVKTGRISFVDGEGVVQKGNSVGTIFIGYNLPEGLPSHPDLLLLSKVGEG